MNEYDGRSKVKGRIALVGCSARKLHAELVPATDLFSGSAYLAARDYAMNKFDGWFILSAKYGLLHPYKHVSYYDVYLGTQSPEYRAEWARRVAIGIREAIEPGSSLTFLCGKHYWKGLVDQLESDYQMEFPLAHLRQGEQLEYLREQTGGRSISGSAKPRPPRVKTAQPSSEMTETMNMPNTEDFKRALLEKFVTAEAQGLEYIEINAGVLHSELGGYPDGGNHRMSTCSGVMRKSMRGGDVIVSSPKKGKGASLTIRYILPRT